MSKDIKGLFLAHRRELQTYLTRKLRDAETAADLTQEAFLRFAERGRNGGAAAVLNDRSYLYRTAHNLAVDHIRQCQRIEAIGAPVELLDEVADDQPSPEHVARAHADIRLARELLAELPERTRQVIALLRIEGLTHREVAERLGISSSSVQKHLAKAVQHLVSRLRERN